MWKETAQHLLLKCELYKEERKALFSRIKDKIKVGTINMLTLLHTKIGISEVLVFLKETNTYTRDWHISRNKEEEEEELDPFWDL